MEAITIPHIHIPSVSIDGICLPGIGVPDGGKKGLVWPKGLKESIKAIYDPAKQGMTNYDVIESYAEDFSSSSVNGKHGEATVNGQKITVTNVILKERDIVHVSITDDNYYLMLHVSGMTVSNQLRIAMYHNIGGYEHVNLNNGINKIYISGVDRRIFIEGNVVGECNITITQLPTSILKDLSGNGNHAYLYGGKGKLNSGMGIYNYIFNNGGNTYQTKRYDKYATLIPKTPVNGNLKFEIINAPNPDLELSYEIIEYRDDDTVISYHGTILTNGIRDFKPGNNTVEIQFRFGGKQSVDLDKELIIRLLPNAYPNQLCYDGKMYAVCYGFPILTDYTVMADRTWFDNMNRACFLSKTIEVGVGAFIFEIFGSSSNFDTYSYGKGNTTKPFETGITYQTKNSYNGNSILSGNFNDRDTLTIGRIRPTEKNGYVGCHGKIIIADRSFTEDEITWLKDNFFTINIPTPAYDFDFSKLKSGENTFTDKYGNELSLHNFAWSGMSGKDGYAEDFTTWNKTDFPIITNKSITINSGVTGAGNWLAYTLNPHSSLNVYVSGLDSNDTNYLRYNYYENGNRVNINLKNGLNILPSNEDNSQSGFYCNSSIPFINNVTITQLPLYPNALVFDGIDDYCKLSKMTIKTVILDFVNLELNRQIYDNRDKPNNHYDFSIYPEADTIAYEARNSDGKTYIDGELNTTIKTNDLLEVRCIVCASNNSAKETEQYISKDSLLNNFYGKMALYRITGFTEVLTPDQVWKWYQKNQPKGGDK